MKIRGFLIFICCLGFPAVAAAKLKVVTTTTDLAALVREVGQEQVEVESLCRGDQDPHYLEPKPSFVVKLNQADLVIEVGLQLEIGWLPVLLIQSRNPAIQPGSPGHLDASEGIRRLEIPEGKIDRSQGDVHPEGNPHYWLNPENGLILSRRITERLAQLDPQNSPLYQKNAEVFTNRLQKKMMEWRRRGSFLRGRKVVTYHKTFSYFVDWTGLNVIGQLEPKPGIPPSPAHLLHLISRVRQEKVPLMITENYFGSRPGRELAEKTGARSLTLPTSVGGEPSIPTYEGLFEFLITRLQEAL